jgi:hypothetical protein
VKFEENLSSMALTRGMVVVNTCVELVTNYSSEIQCVICLTVCGSYMYHQV